MILKFNYNVNNNDELLEAFKHHAKNNPKTYEFKEAYSLDGEKLPSMTAVYEWRPEKEPYESSAAYKNKINKLLLNHSLNE